MFADLRSLVVRAWALLLRNPALLLLGLLLNSYGGLGLLGMSGGLAQFLVVVGVIVFFLVSLRATAGLITGIDYAATSGQTLTFRTLWAMGRARMWNLLRLYLVVALFGLMLIIIVVLAAGGLVAAIAGVQMISVLAQTDSGSALGLTGLGATAAGAVAWLVFSVLSAIVDLGTQAAVLEPVNGYGALSQGWRIFRHNFRPVALLALAAAAIVLAQTGLTNAVDALTGTRAILDNQDGFTASGFLAGSLYALFWMVIRAPFDVFSLLLWTLYYRQLRPTPDPIYHPPVAGATLPLPPILARADAAALPDGGATVAMVARPNWTRPLLQWVALVVLGILLLRGATLIAAADANLLDWQSTVISNEDSSLRGVAVSPDGKTVASCGGGSNNISLWNVADPGGNVRATWNLSAGCHDVAFSPDGRLLASADDGGNIRLVQIDAPQIAPRTVFTYNYFMAAVAFSPDGRTLAFGGDMEMLDLQSLSTPQDLRELKGGFGLEDVVYSTGGDRIVGAGLKAAIWDVAAGTSQKLAADADGLATAIALGPDDNSLAIALHDLNNKTYQVLLYSSPKEQTAASKLLVPTSTDINALAFSPDGRWLAIAANHLYLVDLTSTAKLVSQLIGHSNEIGDVAFDKAGRLFSAGRNGDVRLWVLPAK